MYSRERKIERQRPTDTKTETDRQTDRHTDRQTETERDQHVSLTYWSVHILRLWIADVNV